MWLFLDNLLKYIQRKEKMNMWGQRRLAGVKPTMLNSVQHESKLYIFYVQTQLGMFFVLFMHFFFQYANVLTLTEN